MPCRPAVAHLNGCAVTDCTLYRIEKSLMVRLLHEQHGISEMFITHSAYPQHSI